MCALPSPQLSQNETDNVIRLFTPHKRQRQVLEHPARFKVVVCGRRFGKTEAAKIWAIERAIRGKVIWWILPNYSYATEVWEELKELLRPIRVNKKSGESQRKILLPNEGSITVKSAHDPDSLRGRGLDGVVMDEAAMIPTDAAWETLRPALSDKLGEALFLTTPKGRNWLFRLWLRGRGNTALNGGWASFHFPTWESPTVPINEVEDARRDMTELGFRQEYAAQFLRDAGLVFRNLSACFGTPLGQARANRRHKYVMGVDWGQSNDYTVITVMDADTHEVVYIDRFNKISWAFQRDRLKAQAARWSPKLILAETNSIGQVNIEALQESGLPVTGFQTTLNTKSEIIRALATGFENAELRIPKWDVLLDELQAYQMERLPSGRWTFNAPSGVHDDCVISLALAWWAVTRYSIGEAIFV